MRQEASPTVRYDQAMEARADVDVVPKGFFFGRQVRQRELGGVHLVENSHSAPHRIGRHVHEFPYLYYVLRGASQETFEGKTRTATAHSVFFQPAGIKHENHWLAAGACLHLELDKEMVARISSAGAELSQPFELPPGNATRLALRIHDEMNATDSASNLFLEGLVLELLAQMCRIGSSHAGGTPPKWLVRAKDLIESTFQDNLSLHTIADAVGTHPAHLAKMFRRYYRCTVGDYIREARIKAAQRLLSGSRMPLGEIALGAGYSDQSHFCRSFVKSCGVSPLEFRRIAGKRPSSEQ